VSDVTMGLLIAYFQIPSLALEVVCCQEIGACGAQSSFGACFATAPFLLSPFSLHDYGKSVIALGQARESRWRDRILLSKQKVIAIP